MNTSKLFLLFAFVFGVAAMALAGPPPALGGGGGGGAAPIDGGISILVGGIAAYGAKKLRDQRKAKATQKEI